MTNDEPGSFKATDIHAACEEIFQLHKRHIIVNWTNHSGLNIDSVIEQQAINRLESQNIIFKPNPSDSSTTQINPIVTSASSYDDALTIMKEKGDHSPTIISPIIKDSTALNILEPPKKKKSKILWIILAILVALFLLFNFVPFYKWL